MSDFKEIIRTAIAVNRALKSTPRTPPPHIQEAFADMLSGGKSDETTQSEVTPQILTQKAMQLVILGILKQGTITCSEIIDRLGELHVEFETKGDGAIFGLLHQMEDGNLVETRFEESTALTRYQITDAGEGILQRDGSAAFDGLGLSALLSPQ